MTNHAAQAPVWCPVYVQLAIAAICGPQHLCNADAEHVLYERCPSCEIHLAKIWSRRNPPCEAHLALKRGEIPPDGAYGFALLEWCAKLQ